MPIAPLVCVVNFHHARGPEIECWFGIGDGEDPAVTNDWSYLPFMAMSDGVHTYLISLLELFDASDADGTDSSTEDFSYFTLRKKGTPTEPPTSLFGISCAHQLDSNELLIRPDDVTRSTVQKAVVVVAESPHYFGPLREKLSMVTRAWFAQRDFTDVDILKKFQESLVKNLPDSEDDKEQYLGLSLRELIYEFKHQTLVLFKCCLLQPKMLFFGTRCDRLCMVQFALISLIPGLLRRLEDCADPELDNYAKSFVMPTTLKTSERSSLLANMGLPLQIFGKGSLFGPYTPLQQLDVLADAGTKSYLVGSTNSLLLQQRDRYSDILINLDDSTINITSPSLRSALSLSAADRRWIDYLHQTIVSTWDESNPSQTHNYGYRGSEEFIRLQFEEYLLALLSCVKHSIYLESNPHAGGGRQAGSSTPYDTLEDPIIDYSKEWVAAWQQTANYALFSRTTDPHLFDIVEAKHPTAGALTIEDVNRRLAQQIQEYHLDERFATSKEVVSKHFATGRKNVTTAFSKVMADIEAQKKKYEESRRLAQTAAVANGETPKGIISWPASPASTSTTDLSTARPVTPVRGGYPKIDTAALRARAPDLTQAQAKAGAYFSSWGNWASEKRKGWGRGGTETERPPEGAIEKEHGWGGLGSAATSPMKRKKSSREEKGLDGIGRLDA